MIYYHEAVFILIQTTIGIGVLSVPYTLTLSGMPVGFVFLLYFLLVTYYSVHLLIKLKTQTFLGYISLICLRSIPLLAYQIFGKFSFYFFTLLLSIAQIVITITYLLALIDFVEDKVKEYQSELSIMFKLIILVIFTLINLAFSYYKNIENYKYVAYLYMVFFVAYPISLFFISSETHHLIPGPAATEPSQAFRSLASLPPNGTKIKYSPKEDLTFSQRLLNFDGKFFEGFPRLVVAYTFQGLYFTTHNALSLKDRTEYRGMCMGFISTLVSTVFFFLMTFLLIWKNFVTVHGNQQYEFQHLAQMQVTGYFAILLIFLHGPIVYYNAKDMMLIVIGQIRQNRASQYLSKSGLSSRIQKPINLPMPTGSVNTMSDVDQELQNSIKFEVPEIANESADLQYFDSFAVQSFSSSFNRNVTKFNNSPTSSGNTHAQCHEKNQIFLRDFTSVLDTERSAVNRSQDIRSKTEEAMNSFRETVLYDNKYYYKDLSILNAIVFVLCILVFLGQESRPQLAEILEWTFSALPLCIVCYIFPSLAYLKKNGIKWKYSLVVLSLVVSILMLLACFPLLIWHFYDSSTFNQVIID